MTKILQMLLISVALASGTVSLTACSTSRNGDMVRPIDRGEAAPTRPVRPVSEEKSWSDKAGEITIVILGVAVAIGAVVVPILLL